MSHQAFFPPSLARCTKHHWDDGKIGEHYVGFIYIWTCVYNLMEYKLCDEDCCLNLCLSKWKHDWQSWNLMNLKQHLVSCHLAFPSAQIIYVTSYNMNLNAVANKSLCRSILSFSYVPLCLQKKETIITHIYLHPAGFVCFLLESVHKLNLFTPFICAMVGTQTR